MDYDIRLVPKDSFCTIAVVEIDGKFYGSQEVCSTNPDVVIRQIEDCYLKDERNKPYSSVKELELPIDIETIQVFGEGYIQTNKGFIVPETFVATEGWTPSIYAGKTFYQPPKEWIPPVLEVTPIDITNQEGTTV